MSKGNINRAKSTNFFDFLIAMGGGISNLLKVEKISCFGALYLIIRDFIFIFRLPPGTDYQPFLIDTKLLGKIFESSSNFTIILIFIIALLLCVIFMLMLNIKNVYKKEIDRLSEERSQLLHNMQNDNFTSIKVHKTSNSLGNLKQEV